MDRGEFWLLNSVLRWTSPIDVLVASDDQIWRWFGYAGSGLAQPALVNALLQLFQRGDLIATRTDRERNNRFEQFVPTRHDIEAGLAQEQYFDYGLTDQGGKYWEAIAQAEWRWFLDVVIDFEGKAVTISGSDRNVVEGVLAAWSRLQDFTVVAPVWNMKAPWLVTYWKTLPVGYCLTYQYDYSKSKTSAFDQQPYPDLPEWYREPR